MTKKENPTVKVLAVLRETFPHCFKKGKAAQPLKIGILQDLFEHYSNDEDMSKRKLRFAVRYYTYSINYLKNTKANAARIDLQGVTVDKVTLEQAEHAAETLKLERAARHPQKDKASV